ncbi:hypothetical protein JZ751_013044 [Albula glossodonta]|uniref:Uncharacterized protein n=1 Tax=Albula glossodonta TaxID=121402 RepID=A0A8T2NVY3_9TELE|nr:hypothetical protein JZ751_013044 [Albula glossodonta]
MNRLRGEVELEKSVRRLRETFHGKIPIERATVLMHRYANNYRVVVQDIILMKDREQLKTLPLTAENLRMFNEAQQNLTPSDIHQFACENCDQDWWRKVPKRKRVFAVITCPRCHAADGVKGSMIQYQLTECGELLSSTVPPVSVPSVSGFQGAWVYECAIALLLLPVPGSTVNTCLSQGSLLEELNQLILDDIQEEDEDDLSGSDSNSS